MAVILRSGATSKSTRAAAATTDILIRTTTVQVLRTGLIGKIIDQDGKTLAAVNLGHQGDNEVSRLVIEPWGPISSDFSPAIVFIGQGVKTTLSMSGDGAKYYIDIPYEITKQATTYKMSFILQEKINTEEDDGSNVDFSTLFMRQAIAEQLIGALTFGVSFVVNALLALFRKDKKSVSDVFANTKVVFIEEEE